MSRENAEVVQAAFDAFMQGDYEGVLRLCDDNMEVTQAAGFLGVPRKQHGHAGMLEAFDAWPEEWDDYTVEILAVADLGDHVMVRQISSIFTCWRPLAEHEIRITMRIRSMGPAGLEPATYRL